MPVHAIPLTALPAGAGQSRAWCVQLEAGGILYFPQTPVPIPAADLDFLLSRQQSGSRLHKNIAYKPAGDALSGVDRSASSAEEFDRLHDVMRRYSASVSAFLADFLAPYRRRWQLDYASYRPIEEEGRDLPTRRRNDLLHTDAFPTRPTRGARILRFFHNIHPTRTRDWVVGEPFPRVVGRFVQPSTTAAALKGQTATGSTMHTSAALKGHGFSRAGHAPVAVKGTGFSPYIPQPQKTRALAPEGSSTPHPLALPHPDSPAVCALKQLARATGLAALIPRLKRTPYDDFMMRLHNAMKEDAEFQRTCAREEVKFAPGSSWMVYTETVPHAVLGGQYALEQTFLVDAAVMVAPESAPVAVLEKLAGASVV